MYEKIAKTENESESCFRVTLSFLQLPIPHYQFNKPDFHLFLENSSMKCSNELGFGQKMGLRANSSPKFDKYLRSSDADLSLDLFF
jgi:hypothetical protein